MKKNIKTCYAIEESIREITNIPAEILVREGTSNILIVWKGLIPNKEVTEQIEEALKKFGTPIPNHFRECNFVSFIVVL